jgi:hypothetical protein
MATKRPHEPLDDLRAPSLALLALEFRAPWEFGCAAAGLAGAATRAGGDGHEVIVFPGLSASDASTKPLRRYLGSLGYQTQGWSQGFNFGPRAGVLEAAKRQVAGGLRRQRPQGQPAGLEPGRRVCA